VRNWDLIPVSRRDFSLLCYVQANSAMQPMGLNGSLHMDTMAVV
jgi:hypothetical protein